MRIVQVVLGQISSLRITGVHLQISPALAKGVDTLVEAGGTYAPYLSKSDKAIGSADKRISEKDKGTHLCVSGIVHNERQNIRFAMTYVTLYPRPQVFVSSCLVCEREVDW